MSPTLASIDEFLPATQTELSRRIGENAQGSARPIYPVGGRTVVHFGLPQDPPGISLCTTNLARVIDYPARDMTITVEAGIRMDELAKVLEAERQRLPIDVSQSHRATLGGVAATNTSGTRRFGLGTMRDYVIGVSAVDASGRAFKAGGRVVKNVAGYDLCKMLVGSQGTLAVMTQFTLKLRPIPESSTILWATFDRIGMVDQALDRLVTSSTRPVALDLLDARAAVAVAADAGMDLPCHRPVLCIGVEGTARETAWQIETLKSELTPIGTREMLPVSDADATKMWFALAEFQVPSDSPLTFKANLQPSRTVEFVGCSRTGRMYLAGSCRQWNRDRTSARFSHDIRLGSRNAGPPSRIGPSVAGQLDRRELRRRLENNAAAVRRSRAWLAPDAKAETEARPAKPAQSASNSVGQAFQPDASATASSAALGPYNGAVEF